MTPDEQLRKLGDDVQQMRERESVKALQGEVLRLEAEVERLRAIEQRAQQILDDQAELEAAGAFLDERAHAVTRAVRSILRAKP